MRIVAAALLAISVLCVAGAAAAADVGRALLAAGETVAIRDGQTIRLVNGSTIQDRDVLRTGPASNLQVRFTDDSIVSLRENSELRIEEFRFSGKDDGSERAFFRLLKGGLRTITGLIGRARHANYQLGTVVATIGVRGTDYATTLCQQDCRNPDGTLAKDGQYGRVIGMSSGTNRLNVSNELEKEGKTFGINENFYVADAKSIVEPLLVPPDFLANRLEGRKQGGTRDTTAATGKEQAAASSGVQAESRLGTSPPATPPAQLDFVATQDLGSSGTPAVVAGAPTIALVGGFFDAQGFNNEPGDGGAFLPPVNLTTDPAGAASSLATPQKLIGFTIPPGFDAAPNPSTVTGTGSSSSAAVIDETVSNSLDAHWGRWTSGSFVENQPNVFSSTNQLHYLYAPLTPPEVVAAKSGSFPMSLVQGTTPTNHLGQTGTFSISSLTVNFTARTVTLGNVGFSFPSDTFSFVGPNTTPIQFASGKGAFIDTVVSGTCSGSTCLTSTPAVLGSTGIFMGPAGDHLGVGFQARATSGPLAYGTTAKIFSCAGSC